MGGYGWSKMPLKLLFILILAFAINFGLVLGIQLAVSYRIEGSIDEALLSRLDESLSGCEIQDHKEIENTNLHIFLVKRPDGSARFVLFRKHYLLDRYRYLEKACQDAPENGDALWLKAGVTQVEVMISDKTFDGLLRIKSDSAYNIRHAGEQFRNLMFFSCTGLCILEFIAWCLLFRREEIV